MSPQRESPRAGEITEGPLNINLSADIRAQVVRVEFGTALKWLALGADDARAFGLALLVHASKLDGHVTRVEIADEKE